MARALIELNDNVRAIKALPTPNTFSQIGRDLRRNSHLCLGPGMVDVGKGDEDAERGQNRGELTVASESDQSHLAAT